MKKGFFVISLCLVFLLGGFSFARAQGGGLGVGIKEYVGIINFPSLKNVSGGDSFYFLPSINIRNRFNANIALDVDIPIFDTIYWTINKGDFVARGYDFMITANIPDILPYEEIIPSFGLGLGLKLDSFAGKPVGVGLAIPISGGAEYFINPQFSATFVIKSGFDFSISPSDADLWYGIVGGVGVSFFL